MKHAMGFGTALVALALSAPTLVHAAAFAPAFDLQLTAQNTPWFYSTLQNRDVIVDADGAAGDVWGLTGQTSSPNPGLWDLSWDLRFDPDPFITGSVTLTNLTGVTQNFNLSFSLPISPAIPGPSLYKGSITATVTDRNNSGSASIDDYTGNGIYAGLIDGTPILPLFAVSPLQCGPGAGCSASGSDYSAGFPGFIGGGPAANSSIGTTLKFSLSAGDRVTFNTLFEVVSADANPIPVPAAAWLLGSAMVGLVGAARRRRDPSSPVAP